MYKKFYQSGRTLLETLMVSAIIAVLTICGLFGYNFAITKYREKSTAKLIAELAVRYNANPIKPQENDLVSVKSIFPEAERADAVTIKTPDIDTGRVFITRKEEEKAFAIVVVMLLHIKLLIKVLHNY